jgi:hypothetical protein
VSFFVLATGDWAIQADAFARQLRSRWPAALLRESAPRSNACLEFELVMPFSALQGGLSRSGQALSYEGDLRDAATLALWFRSLAPASVPMVLCDEALSGNLELKAGTREADIFRAFDYTPAPAGWMNYDLIPRGGWGVPLPILVQHLRASWPSARIVESEAPESPWSIAFHVPMRYAEVSGTFRQKVHAMVFTGDPRDCAEFALWCRAAVPAKELLLLCDRGNYLLEAGMTVEELRSRLQPS